MTRKIFIFLLMIIFVLSCSTNKRGGPTDNNRNSSESIDSTLDHQNNEQPNQKPEEETVRIGDKGGVLFENNEINDQEISKENKKIKIGLNLGPGLYRAINYVSFLKILERQNLAPHIITGTGFGAIVAAMYAVGMTPEVIEWNFFKYFREKKKEKIYEKSWISEIDQVLLLKFKNMNIQDTKKKFYITLYDHNTQKAYYFDKGNIRDLLLLNLRLSTDLVASKNGQKYSTAFEKEVFNAKLLKQLGADFTIAADVLGNRFGFDTNNNFLREVYKKVAGRIQKEKIDFDYSISLPVQQMNLDSIKDGSLFMQKSYDFTLKNIPTLLNKLHQKTDDLSELGIK